VLGRDTALTVRLTRGTHRLVATAVDRAGNRSPGALQTLRIR
jgi:hypothetical protein